MNKRDRRAVQRSKYMATNTELPANPQIQGMIASVSRRFLRLILSCSRDSMIINTRCIENGRMSALSSKSSANYVLSTLLLSTATYDRGTQQKVDCMPNPDIRAVFCMSCRQTSRTRQRAPAPRAWTKRELPLPFQSAGSSGEEKSRTHPRYPSHSKESIGIGVGVEIEHDCNSQYGDGRRG